MLRPTLCSHCSCLGLLGLLVKYHKGETLDKYEALNVREAIESRGDYYNDKGEFDGFRCYMDADDKIQCRGQQMAEDYISKHNLVWKK